MKIRIIILAAFLLAGALLVSGCVSNPDPAIKTPKPSETAINEAGPGSSGSSGNSGNVGPGVTETPENSNTQQIETFKSENWYDFYPNELVQPQILELGNSKVEIYATAYLQIVLKRNSNDRFYLEYKVMARNKKDHSKTVIFNCKSLGESAECSDRGTLGEDLRIDRIKKEWEWNVEITKFNVPPTQPSPTARQPEKLKKTT